MFCIIRILKRQVNPFDPKQFEFRIPDCAGLDESFPSSVETASVSYNDIACVLSNPLPAAQTARLSNIFKFSDNLKKVLILCTAFVVEFFKKLI